LAAVRFEISYSRFNNAVMSILVMGRRQSLVELDDTRLRVRFGSGGYGFASDIPRPAIVAADRFVGRVYGWGVHGWGGAWLVNGSSHGIVALTLQPLQRGRVLMVPVKLRRLRLSLVDPDAFLAALNVPAAPADVPEADRTAAG
jgi:hypothetical protein